jgi:hypothetical protein
MKQLLTATMGENKYGFGSVGHNGQLTQLLRYVITFFGSFSMNTNKRKI